MFICAGGGTILSKKRNSHDFLFDAITPIGSVLSPIVTQMLFVDLELCQAQQNVLTIDYKQN